MAGTGVWRSQLIDRRCPACQETFEQARSKEQQALRHRKRLVEILGGEKPYREFTFERYQVEPGNELAFRRCREFNPATENLYLWGACGVGKTHLAFATARRCFEETLAVVIQPAGQLSRKVRMKDPSQEQATIEELMKAEALVLDDLGAGTDTAFSRHLLQEILDGRDFNDRRGLVVTSKYSLDQLAAKLADDSIPSRLCGMCQRIQVNGNDRRVSQRLSL